jgi:hypothetical protein
VTTPRKLTLDDIADLRAYERERDEFRRHVIELKRRRRASVGTIVTFVFENRDTVRFQIQEMARVEKIITDEGIGQELAAYNPLIPEPGQVSATMFIELTTQDQLREWLPKLVGVERSVELRLADGSAIPCVLEAGHEAQLTDATVTASVHYVRWDLTPEQVDTFAAGPVHLAVTHPAYEESLELPAWTVEELLADLRP